MDSLSWRVNFRHTLQSQCYNKIFIKLTLFMILFIIYIFFCNSHLMHLHLIQSLSAMLSYCWCNWANCCCFTLKAKQGLSFIMKELLWITFLTCCFRVLWLWLLNRLAVCLHMKHPSRCLERKEQPCNYVSAQSKPSSPSPTDDVSILSVCISSRHYQNRKRSVMCACLWIKHVISGRPGGRGSR